MPQVGLALVGGATTLGVGATLAIQIGASLAFSAIAQKKARSAASGSFGTELYLSGDPNDPRYIIYGRAWTAGTVRYRNSTGTNNREIYLLIVLAGHECAGVDAVEAERETLTLDGSGNVTSPSKWVGRMNVRFVLGTDSQSADSTLDTAFSNWTSNHRLRGCTYAIVKLTYDEENLNSVPALRFLVKGRKVYDPRLDTTNGGSGSHLLATPSTWEWSENPVLCHNDYWRGVMINSIRIAGPGVSSARFSWANVIAEANVCDENVSLAAGGTEERYTSNGIIDPRSNHGEVLEMFEQAMAGDIAFSDGKWRYFAGAYRAPSLALTADHFVGPLRIVVHKGESDRKDTAHGRFSSLAESGTTISYSPVSLSTATAGSERVTSIDMQLVNDLNNAAGYDGGARAQRIAKLLLERDAAGKLITCTTNLYGLRAVPGESISVTHGAFGLSSQVMRVMDVSLRPVQDGDRAGLVVDLLLGAGPSSLYTWSAEETAIAASPVLPQQVIPWGQITSWTQVLANVSQLGSTFTKTGGADATWGDAAVSSQEGYPACTVSWRASQTNKRVMVALNSDPTTDHSYTSLDFALYMRDDGNIGCWESNTEISTNLGSYSTSDQLTISYDGLRISYYKNGTLLRTVPLVGARLFLDSSFYGSGAAINSVSFGPITHVLANAVGWAADSQGKPAGVRGVQSIADRSQLSIVGGSLRIASSPDDTVGYGLPAIPIDDSKTYQVTIRHRSSGSSADGLYLRFYELAGPLPAGKTHVGSTTDGTVEAIVEDRDSVAALINDGPMPGTTPVTQTFTYTPTSGTEFASFGMLNYDAASSVDYDVEWVALTELGSDIDLLPGVLPPIDTFGLNPAAATAIYSASNAGAAVDVSADTNGPYDCRVFVEQNGSRTYGIANNFPDFFGGTGVVTAADAFDVDADFDIEIGVALFTDGSYTGDLESISSIDAPVDDQHIMIVNYIAAGGMLQYTPDVGVTFLIIGLDTTIQGYLIKR